MGVTGVYDSASSSSLYQKGGKTRGRFDQVYLQWEDPAFRQALIDFFQKTGFLSRVEGPVRILDLGCGPGKGLELLTGLIPDRSQHPGKLPPPMIRNFEYHGVDLSPGMIESAREEYGNGNPGIRFDVHDLTHGLPMRNEPVHIYFSSYGTMSHFEDGILERIVEGMMDGMESPFVLVLDLLGKLSAEWPEYRDQREEGILPYAMTHLHQGDGPVETFPMRFWTGEGIADFMQGVARKHGVKILSRKLVDRSLITGRHMDTGSFRSGPLPIRSAVNSLFTPGHRTDLSTLIIPESEFADPEKAPLEFFHSWNDLVYEAIRLLESESLPVRMGDDVPALTLELIRNYQRIVETGKDLPLDDIRADYLEPLLAHSLRRLEAGLEKGKGQGHSLLAFFELGR